MGTLAHRTYENQRRQYSSGGWWRFSRYEIRDGAIRPTEDAVLGEYDPWQLYRISEWDSGTPPPYHSLIALMTSIGAFFDEALSMWRLGGSTEDESPISFKENSLTSSEQAAILDWCPRFGLLGILPHTALTIQLPIRYSPRVGAGLQVEREHIRVNGKWLRRVFARCTPRVVESAEFLDEEMRVVFPEDHNILDQHEVIRWPILGDDDEFFRVPKAAFFSKFQTGVTPDFDGNVSMGELLHRFFPDIQRSGDSFECPLPLTPEFWGIYSEQLHDFLESAMAFLDAVESISAYPRTASPSHLEWFLEPIGVSLSIGSDLRLQEQWVCPSLLSSFARMAVHDLSADRRIRRCDCCGQPFVTNRPTARYCSQPCGWRYRKRQARPSKTYELPADTSG